jgi:hypothetical protein
VLALKVMAPAIAVAAELGGAISDIGARLSEVGGVGISVSGSAPPFLAKS